MEGALVLLNHAHSFSAEPDAIHWPTDKHNICFFSTPNFFNETHKLKIPSEVCILGPNTPPQIRLADFPVVDGPAQGRQTLHCRHGTMVTAAAQHSS